MVSKLRPDGSSKNLGQTHEPLMSSSPKKTSEIADLSTTAIPIQPLQSPSLIQRNAHKIISILMLLLDEDTKVETFRQVGGFDLLKVLSAAN